MSAAYAYGCSAVLAGCLVVAGIGAVSVVLEAGYRFVRWVRR